MSDALLVKVFGAGVFIISGIISFFLKKSFKDMEDIQDEIKELPEKYVLKADYKDDFKEVKDSLKTIETDIKSLITGRKL